MARACTICSRPDAGQINEMLRDGRSARSIALEIGTSDDAMQRHAANHAGVSSKVVTRVTTSRRPAEVVSRLTTSDSGDPLDPLDELVDALHDQALHDRNPAIVHQYRLALAAQQAAAHAAAPVRDLATEPDWIELRTLIFRALEGYPDAKFAIVDALRARRLG